MIKLEFWTTEKDINEYFDFFKSIEMIENVFDIQFRYTTGSFEDQGEAAEVDVSCVKWNGTVYTEPLKLSVMYDEEERSFAASFSNASVKPMTKKQQLHYNVWKREQAARKGY